MPQKRYNLPSPKKKGQFLYWLFAVGLLVLLGWLWWEAGKGRKKTKSAALVAQKAVTKTNSPRHVSPSISLPPTVVSNAPRSQLPAPTNAPNAPAGNGALAATSFPRPVRNAFEAQLALVELGISSGSLDGAIGSQTRAALAAFQRSENLPATGELDAATREKLLLQDEPYTSYTVTAEDLARLHPIPPTWLGKSEQTSLDYETILELVAEKSFSHPNLIKLLNPTVNWDNVPAGTVLKVPNAAYPEAASKAAWIMIHLSARVLEAFDAQTNLLVHFPCSIAKRVDKRPVGELHVAVVAPNPNYTFDPEVFPESAEAHELKRKLIIPPGPNNPVGVAWIGLDKPGYGIHGTPAPEAVGRTESHGCFRLANWNAEYLLKLIAIGTPVYVVE